MIEEEIKQAIIDGIKNHRKEIDELFHMNLIGQDIEHEILGLIYKDNNIESESEKQKWFKIYLTIPTKTLRHTIWND